MSQASFIVYDLTTGDIKRHGKCPAEHVASQARANKNEGVKLDQSRTKVEAKALMIEQRVIMPSKGSVYLRRRPAVDIEDRMARVSTSFRPPGIPELIAVLKDKHGITVTAADLTAAMSKQPSKPA